MRVTPAQIRVAQYISYWKINVEYFTHSYSTKKSYFTENKISLLIDRINNKQIYLIIHLNINPNNNQIKIFSSVIVNQIKCENEHCFRFIKNIYKLKYS